MWRLLEIGDPIQERTKILPARFFADGAMPNEAIPVRKPQALPKPLMRYARSCPGPRHVAPPAFFKACSQPSVILRIAAVNQDQAPD